MEKRQQVKEKIKIMPSSIDCLEIEVKFHLADADAMRQRLIHAGASAGPERFESNLRYENPEGTLKTSDRLLRLRRDDACRLTFKKRPESNGGECKTYHELEVKVSDFDTMAAILDQLGFEAVQRYDKRRQTFVWNDVEICIDTMPFGTFMEIEGGKAGIRAAAAALDLPWERRILSNYLAIFELLRSSAGLPFRDVTFENFERVQIDMAPYLPLLWAGSSPGRE
jgi:adenylate cyclase class 2